MNEAGKSTLASYILGFIYSLELTFAAYFLVSKHLIFGNALIAAIITLAIVQLFVQLIFFLHLERGSNYRWNLTVLAFAALVVLILVLGSLWIMNSLNYHHEQITPGTDQFIIKDEGYKP